MSTLGLDSGNEQDIFRQINTSYIATANGTGYSSGDVLSLVVVINILNNSIVSSIWLNSNTSLVLSSPPTGGTYTLLNFDVGSATSALQVTGNTTLDSIASFSNNTADETSNINAKLPVLGQALNAGSVPVVLPATQLTTLTPLTSVGRTWNLNGTTDAVTLATGTNTIGSVRLTDGTNISSVFNLTNSKPLAIALVDGVGNQVSSFGGGGTQYVDNQVLTSPTGTVSLGYDGNSTKAIAVNDQGELIVSDTLLNDTISLLSRVLTSLTPLTNTDVAQRQLVTIDAMTPGLALGSITSALPAGANTIGDVTVGGAGYELFMAQQRAAYNTCFI